VIDRIAPRFARYEPLRHASELMLGMVSGLDRKNCWTIAEHRGDATPDGLQHLLARARWDAHVIDGGEPEPHRRCANPIRSTMFATGIVDLHRSAGVVE